MSQIRQQIITTHIVPNISRSKGNKAMKFDQLLQCRVRDIFLQKIMNKKG